MIPFRLFYESIEESPFAVFVVHQFPDGTIAATTRPSDRSGDDEGVRYGLPGGKVDPGEDPMEAAIRESEEEGWSVNGLDFRYAAEVQGKLVWWYHAKKALPLTDYKERHRGIRPIKVGMDKLQGFGNDVAIPNSIEERIQESTMEGFDQKWQSAIAASEELRVALDLMKHIKSKNQGDIYIVGGVPRDLLMGNEVDDVDMATNIPFEDIARDFQIRNISKNDSQPVYTILWKGYNYDLAKFRTDSGDIGRQNNVSTETDSFEADSSRRDISINSFGLDENGAIVDYQGGLEDLKNKIIRAVGDPKKRFMEDATRILRVFRFAAKMDFDIEENTKRAAIELKDLLSDPGAISMESISKEFYKSAKSGRTLANFLKKLQDTGILHDILPEFTSMEGYSHNPKHHPEGDSQVLGHIYECLKVSPYTDPVINLAVLFHDFGKATTKGEKDGHSTYHGHEAAGVPIVEGIFKRLRFAELSPQDKKHILAAVDRHMLVHKLDDLNPKTLSKLVLNPSWEVIKAVGYCDEASRGPGMFDKAAFEEKIARAEAKVQKLGGNADDLRKRIKQYVDGNKLMGWFPELRKDQTPMRTILPKLQEYIINLLDAGEEPDQEEIKRIAQDYLEPVPVTENFNRLYRELMTNN
jgi:tRNA nucleotidyltransferase (CCA-adding enzyme)